MQSEWTLILKHTVSVSDPQFSPEYGSNIKLLGRYFHSATVTKDLCLEM